MILVGGLLGAGKTTLLARAAGYMIGQGKRVGLITNDQATDVVDTAFLNHSDLHVEEIAGGCFLVALANWWIRLRERSGFENGCDAQPEPWTSRADA